MEGAGGALRLALRGGRGEHGVATRLWGVRHVGRATTATISIASSTVAPTTVTVAPTAVTLPATTVALTTTIAPAAPESSPHPSPTSAIMSSARIAAITASTIAASTTPAAPYVPSTAAAATLITVLSPPPPPTASVPGCSGIRDRCLGDTALPSKGGAAIGKYKRRRTRKLSR